MYSLETATGLLAALCTTLANVPQVKKTWQTRRADDLSLKMLLLLMGGVVLWIVYGAFKNDAVIILANGITFALLAIILYFKLRYPQRAEDRQAGVDCRSSR